MRLLDRVRVDWRVKSRGFAPNLWLLLVIVPRPKASELVVWLVIKIKPQFVKPIHHPTLCVALPMPLLGVGLTRPHHGRKQHSVPDRAQTAKGSRPSIYSITEGVRNMEPPSS